jgi:hypothetical protein
MKVNGNKYKSYGTRKHNETVAAGVLQGRREVCRYNMESIFQKVFIECISSWTCMRPTKSRVHIPPLTPIAVSRFNRSSALMQPLLLRHWLDDVLFAKILDCRSGSDEARPGVSRQNLSITLFVLHITMNKGCAPASRGEANSKPHVALVLPDLLDSGNNAESVRRIAATPVGLCSLHLGYAALRVTPRDPETILLCI